MVSAVLQKVTLPGLLACSFSPGPREALLAFHELSPCPPGPLLRSTYSMSMKYTSFGGVLHSVMNKPGRSCKGLFCMLSHSADGGGQMQSLGLDGVMGMARVARLCSHGQETRLLCSTPTGPYSLGSCGRWEAVDTPFLCPWAGSGS